MFNHFLFADVIGKATSTHALVTSLLTKYSCASLNPSQTATITSQLSIIVSVKVTVEARITYLLGVLSSLTKIEVSIEAIQVVATIPDIVECTTTTTSPATTGNGTAIADGKLSKLLCVCTFYILCTNHQPQHIQKVKIKWLQTGLCCKEVKITRNL